MNQDYLMTVIEGPHVSEKTTQASEKYNQVVFQVRKDATKEEVKQAVELMFEVKVESVQVLNSRGKLKRTGRSAGRRKSTRKAYVRLAEGDDIDFLGAD
ncbi:MAG: 50S ribosomal protein L23 [Gammaproteobacteria bacterium]|nr:50S ribosomal protein L23 [Gammaproteobacteria bacterium]